MPQFLRIQGANLAMAKDQPEYLTLYVRAQNIDFGDGNGLVVTRSFAVEFTPDEMQALHEGQPLILTILGGLFPPIKLHVGDNGKNSG